MNACLITALVAVGGVLLVNTSVLALAFIYAMRRLDDLEACFEHAPAYAAWANTGPQS